MATVLYLGTDDGVVTVAGDGSSWEVENQALAGWEVCEVAVNPRTPNVAFAATRGDGVWRSEDRGRSWRKPSYGRRGPGKVRCLTQHPADERTLFAGTEPIDVWVSPDAGQSWEYLDSVRDLPFVHTITYPVPSVEPHVRDIAVDPANPRVMYAALQVGYMLKTVDGGCTWKLLDKDLDSDVHTISLNPRRPAEMLIATGGFDCRSGKVKGRALYRSRDGGETWQPTAASFPHEYSVPLVVDASNPNVAFAGLAHGTPNDWRRRSGAEAIVVRTTDGGESWQEVASDVPEAGRCMAIGLAIDPSNSANVFAALSDGHILATHDGGDTWTRLGVQTPPPNDIKCVRE